jgi:hypothetical protein
MKMSISAFMKIKTKNKYKQSYLVIFIGILLLSGISSTDITFTDPVALEFY